jgi:hypothetical protein
MKTWSTHRQCPLGEGCPGEIELVYEVGKGIEEFWLIEDDVYCSEGHSIPGKCLDKWYKDDANEYGAVVYDNLEGMRYYHESGGL